MLGADHHRGFAMFSPNTRNARRWLWPFCGALLVLRIVYAWALRINSDEPQHLHVVWGWTQGLLPYRDVFDNHTPLFQLLSAPLFAAIGERAEILPLMRLATIPWYALALWCTYRIGRALFDARTGAWAAVLTALMPAFFILFAQFRTDVAWAALWLAMVMVAIEGRPTPRRAFCVGLLAGAACAVSLKSLLLLGTLGGSALLVLALQRALARRMPLREIATTLLFAVAGFAVLPAVIALSFYAAGAWDAFVYCVFVHNLVPGLGNWEHNTGRFFIFPIALIPVTLVGRELMRRDADVERGAKRAFVWSAAMLYVAALTSYWPLLTRQDLLPFRPLIAVFVVALLLHVYRSSAGWRTRAPLRLILPLCAEFFLLLSDQSPFKDRVHRYVTELRDVQWLSNADDYVMDAKGEAIFRRRPFYFALEQITLKRIELGLIPDTISQALRATSTAVIVSGPELDRVPAATRNFIEHNYVPVRRRIRVAGVVVPDAPVHVRQTFEVALPLQYALIDSGGRFTGRLDGSDYSEPRVLSPGTHVLERSSGAGAVAVVWAQAIERGFAPDLAMPQR